MFTRDGMEYSNIRKLAEYLNSKTIFDYLIYGGRGGTKNILAKTVERMSK